jgi:hypothetical protein
MRQQYFVRLLRGLFNDPGSSVLHRRACARVRIFHHGGNEAGRAGNGQALMIQIEACSYLPSGRANVDAEIARGKTAAINRRLFNGKGHYCLQHHWYIGVFSDYPRSHVRLPRLLARTLCTP